MIYDITFCNRDCNNKQCQRNLKYIDRIRISIFKPYISISAWKNCKDFKGDENK